jgi:CHAT domain-containing protein
LIRREVPAVVAMQFEITDSAAIRFAETFYQHVAKGRSVDDSVMRARRAVKMANRNSLEWGTPVLYLRAPDGRIFDVTDLPTMQRISSPDPVPYRRAEVHETLESASQIDRATKQEEVSSLLHRVFVEHNRSVINVRIPDHDVWLGFGTFPHHQFGENLNVIYIYYRDPDSVEKASLDTFVNWSEGRSLNEALNRIRNVLRQDPARRQAANFNAGEIIAELKRKVLEITG